MHYPSLGIREIKIKTTVLCHILEWSTLSGNIKCYRGRGKKETQMYCHGSISFTEQLHTFTELSICIIYDSSNSNPKTIQRIPYMVAKEV